MKWTFGIVGGHADFDRLNIIIDSIRSMNMPIDHYEIIINGPSHYNEIVNNYNDINISVSNWWQPRWITGQKNDICRKSKYQNIVLLHDYIIFDQDWYNSFVQFGEDWDVCMNSIINADGTRFRDWVLWKPQWVDYNDHSQIRNMYVSGSYFCVKKDFMIKYPLDETLFWGHGEDVKWSKQVRSFWKYRCNPMSKVYLLKYKETHISEKAPKLI